jgi:transforming growth factor-beta-induced protein
MTQPIEEILANCLDTIAEGRMTAEACLAAHPEQREELAGLLAAADRVRHEAGTVEPVTPAPEFRAAARERLLARLPARQGQQPAAGPAQPVSVLPVKTPAPLPGAPETAVGRKSRPPRSDTPATPVTRRAIRPLTLFFGLLLLLLVGSAGTLYAGNRAIPGDTLYGVKSSVEAIRLERAATAERQVTLRLDFADRRVDEIEKLVERRRLGVITETAEAYAALVRETMFTAERVPQERDRLAQQMEGVVARQAARLELLAEDLAAVQAEAGAGAETPAASLDSAVEAATAVQTYVRTGIIVEEGARLVDVLKLDGRFTRWLAAIESADLAALLEGQATLTLFIPTDSAFDTLPAGVWERITADPVRLREIIRYHILPGIHTADSLLPRTMQETNLGIPVLLDGSSGRVVLDRRAPIITADVPVTHSILHIIDGVLLPPQALYTSLLDDPQLSRFAEAIRQAGLEDQLRNHGPFTVLAPTNAAFEALPPGTWEAISADTTRLRQTLLYHYSQGNLTSANLGSIPVVNTALGIQMPTAGVILGAQVDIRARNGTLHVIDNVLIPERYP